LYNSESQTYQSLNSLGKGSTVSQGGSLSGGVGGGIPFIVSAEVSYQHTFGSTQSQRDNMIIDINGDGLPDKIYNTVGGLHFSPNRGDGTFGAGVQINGAPSKFSYTYTNSTSDGWEGSVDAGAKVAGVALGINAGMDWNTTYSRTTSYMLDVNNDGLVDIVNDGIVYFNAIKYINGIAIPTFSITSKNTQNPIKNTKTAIGESDEIPCDAPIKRSEIVLTKEQEELIKRTPLQDVVRVWEAPYEGIIEIGGNVRLLPCNTVSDGVVLKTQFNQTTILSPISLDNYDPHPINSSCTTTSVKVGDRIFFRLQAGTGVFSDAESDVVLLQPTITYKTGIDRFFESGYSSTVYSPSEEAMINKVGYNLVDTIPTAIVNIRGAFTKPITNSDIVCKVYMSNDSLYLKDSVVYSVNTHNDTACIVY